MYVYKVNVLGVKFSDIGLFLCIRYVYRN